MIVPTSLLHIGREGGTINEFIRKIKENKDPLRLCVSCKRVSGQLPACYKGCTNDH